MFPKEIFGHRVAQLRKLKNLKQDELGAAIGIVKSNVSRIESGQNAPSIDSMVALAEFFDVSVDYLLGRTDRSEVNKQRSEVM